MLMTVIAGGDAAQRAGPSARPTAAGPRPEARLERARDEEDGVLYLMPPAKPWMNFFWANR